MCVYLEKNKESKKNSPYIKVARTKKSVQTTLLHLIPNVNCNIFV